MIETDYVWLKPLAAPLAESSALSIAFPFGYIDPLAPVLRGVMRKMYPESAGPLTDVPASGPAPVLMRWQELFKVRLAVPSCQLLLSALGPASTQLPPSFHSASIHPSCHPASTQLPPSSPAI